MAKTRSILMVLMTIIVLAEQQVCGENEFVSFVFGDSLVDAGNNDYIFTLSKANWPPYGIDFSASGGRPTGRFTNGRTISDIAGELLGSTSFSPPYMAPSSHDTAILNGVNYASGAAGILNDTGSLFIGRISLAQQVSNFQNTKEELIRVLGERAAEKMIAKALFSVTMGSNDFLNNYLIPIVSIPKRAKISPHNFTTTMISQLTIQLQRLYELGGRKFVVSGVGPLGCIPYTRGIDLVPRGSCSESTNSMVRFYNKMLRGLISQLNAQLHGASFVYANSYDALMTILQNYESFGFENVDNPCCGDVIPPVACSKRSNCCKDRSKYVFWDAYHPSEAANYVITQFFVNGNLHYVSPMNISTLYNL